MKNGRMQAKDVPDWPVLRFIHKIDQGQVFPLPDDETPGFEGKPYYWGCWSGIDEARVPANSVRNAMPPGTPDKVVLAKMKRLIDRGLVDGCPCGCRGDYKLTPMGRNAIGIEQLGQHINESMKRIADAMVVQVVPVFRQAIERIQRTLAEHAETIVLRGYQRSGKATIFSARTTAPVQKPSRPTRREPSYLLHDPTKRVAQQRPDKKGHGWSSKRRKY